MFTLTAFASDKPVWTVDFRKLNLPKHENESDPGFNVQFTPDNKILISFVHRSQQTKSATKDMLEKTDSFFVVLLLSGEKGELIRRIEWPIMPESSPAGQTRIYPLPSGGYVGIIDRLDFTVESRKTVTHLQMFDSSFNVIHDRVLDTVERGKGVYRIILPMSGNVIILNQKEYRTRFAEIVEIIDLSTFEIMERFVQPDFGIVGIWKDQLLSISYDGNNDSRIFEKKIGASQWNVLGLTQWTILHVLGLGDSMRYGNPRFIYNGSIVFRDLIGQPPETKEIFFMIEGGKMSGPFFEGCISRPSWNTPVVACKKSKLSSIRLFLDLDSRDWIEAYDLSTRQVLLATKRYTADNLIDYAISPDGDSIVVMTRKKIELYRVNPKKDKKK